MLTRVDFCGDWNILDGETRFILELLVANLFGIADRGTALGRESGVLCFVTCRAFRGEMSRCLELPLVLPTTCHSLFAFSGNGGPYNGSNGSGFWHALCMHDGNNRLDQRERNLEAFFSGQEKNR